MYFTYVLYDGKRYYIGYTSDLKRRTKEHKSGNVKSTKSRKRLELIHYEAFADKEDAQRREKYFKTTKGKKALKLMLKASLQHWGIV